MENRESNNAELTPQQLDRLFELFLACREMDGEARSVWLREACQGDLSLERGVERLICEDLSAEGFLSRPMDVITRVFACKIAEGQRFGRYTITGFVGRGGMGEVWKARDEELDRAVALKFMNAGFAASQLTREARMASALNHPGIVTVYDVTVWEGTPILVMELVTGTPLSRFGNGLIPIDQLLPVASQVSSALAAAHAAGIVHGDLKPDNIIWREDHIAKILDFGLARKAANAGGAALAGTPLYMSPEQARGEAVGTASDVYSLGLVLFELATGQRPFGRQSLDETGSRRAKPPKSSSGRARLPEKLDVLIDRMLEPDAAKRISMHEAAEQLQLRERPSALYRAWKVAALSVCLILAAFLLARLFRHPRSEIDLSRMTVRPLASQPGLEDNPSISPDGLWISCLYRARPVDRPQLQVHSTQGGPPVVIETDGLVVQGPAAWSPDSNELTFAVRKGSREHSIYRVRRTGGTPKQTARCRPRTDGNCQLDWSPDGTTLAIADRWQGNFELYLFELASGRRRDLIAPGKVDVKSPRFSPNGKWIAYSKEATLNSDDIYVVRASGGRPRRITQAPWFLKGFAWSIDGKSLAAISSRRSNKLQMWQFPLNGSAPYPVGELDTDRSSEPALSRRKGSLAWVRDLSGSSLWRMPADGSSQPPEQLVNSAAVDVDAEWSSNGRMVFRSDRSGTSELWIAKAGGADPWQATWFRGTFVGDPHWSPDGRALAFTTHTDGNPDIFVMPCDQNAGCGKPRQLTRSPASDANPTWSADGRWIYFSSSRSGDYEVWRMPADGSAEPERITWNGGYLAHESADGKWLYYSKLRESTGFWRIALPARGRGQPETPVASNVPFKAAGTWALGARELFYYPAMDDPAVPFPPVRAVDLETGRARELPVGNIRLARGLSLSQDGRWLLCTRYDRAQTLVMIAG